MQPSMHDGKQNVTDENYANVTTSFEKGTVTIRSSGTPGDVTGDNDVTIADVVKVNRHVAGRITLTGAELLTADVTGDGDVTIADYPYWQLCFRWVQQSNQCNHSGQRHQYWSIRI